MAEFNGDFNSAGYTLGVNYSVDGGFMRADSDGPGGDGSYIGTAGQFTDRRLVANSNSAAVMVQALGPSLFGYSTPDDESTIRAGFNHALIFTMAPDVWYMNGNRDNGGYTNGVNWASQQMDAWSDGGVDGNYFGRADTLEGKTFRAANDVEVTVVSSAGDSVAFTTTETDEGTFRAGFEFPNMWEDITIEGQEYNGDNTAGAYTLGVAYDALDQTSNLMTANASDGASGSYIGRADDFADRRLIAQSNGAAIMSRSEFPNILGYSTIHDESTIRAGFNHALIFTMAPDVWYMNAEYDTPPFTKGVRWDTQQEFASIGGSPGPAGNWDGRASTALVGKIFRGSNGAIVHITGLITEDNVSFTTTNSEAEIRAGFEFPNMWRLFQANGNTLNDCRFQALRNQGFTGQTNDMLLQWLQANGATSGCLPDAWYEMLISQGIVRAHRNDMWYELLGNLGYEGQLNDRELAFWCDGGVLEIPPFDALYENGEPLTENGEFLTEIGVGPMAEYKDVYPFRANQTDHGALIPADGDVQILGFNELLPAGTYLLHTGFTTDWIGTNDQLAWHVNGAAGIQSPIFLKESKDLAEIQPLDYTIPAYTHPGGQMLISLFAEALVGTASVTITDVTIHAQRVSDPA